MKYVKLRAKNYNEALMQLRMKYGEEAIPISHKYVKEGGILGGAFFAKQVVELTAAYHERPIKGKAATTPLSAAPKRKGIDIRVDDDVTMGLMAGASDDDMPGGDFLQNLAKSTGGVYGRNGKKVTLPPESYAAADDRAGAARELQPIPQPKKTAGDIILSREEYNALKKFEKDFNALKDSEKHKLQSAKDHFLSDIVENNELAPYTELLRKNDFTDEEGRALLDSVKGSLSQDEIKDKVKIEKTLKDLLKSKIVVSGPVNLSSKRKIVMFVGPTGVGKTTSLAKLGAIFSLREGKSVAFITIDTYRIAATEQLKKYADIMKIPVHVVSDQKEFKNVMAKEKAEIILIDTSGRSHRNALKISEIKSYADQVDCDFEKILCVSATTKREDLDSIFSSFGKLEYSSVMITKADETNFLGNVITIADKYNKPISYIANGQEVPNDIMPADADRLADMMMSGTIE